MNRATAQTLFKQWTLFQRFCFGSGLLWILFTIGNQILFTGSTALLWWTDLWWTAISLIAGWLCLDAADRPGFTDRPAWLWFGWGCMAWALGMVAWDIYELFLGWTTPFPSLADVGYSVFGPFMLIGCFLLKDERLSFYERSKLILDSLILINVLALMLVVVFHEAIFQSEIPWMGKLAAIFYPIVPFAVCYALWVMRARKTVNHRPSLDWILAGMILYTVADTGYLAPITTGGYAVGSILDPLWIGAFSGIGLGALKIRLEPPAREKGLP